MANNGFLETARQLQGDVKALLERVALAQSAVADLLAGTKAAEERMIEKEEQERRQEKFRQRLEKKRRKKVMSHRLIVRSSYLPANACRAIR